MPNVCSCPAQISALEAEPALESLLAVSVEMAAFSSSEARPGRPSLAAQCAQQQVRPVQILPCQAFWTNVTLRQIINSCAGAAWETSKGFCCLQRGLSAPLLHIMQV